MKNKISETAKILISLCWKDGKPVSINPYYDTKYEFNNKNYKLTKEIVEEIKETGLVKIWGENKNSVVLTGIGEQPSKMSEVNKKK